MNYSKQMTDVTACSARELREIPSLTHPIEDHGEFNSPKFRFGTDEAKGRRKANRIGSFTVAVMCVVSCSLIGGISRAGAQVAPPTPPGVAYYSIQHADDWPPLPANIWGWPEIDVGGGMIGLNDVGVDYDLLSKLSKASGGGGIYTLDDSGPPGPPGGGGGGGGGGSGGSGFSTNDFWIQLTQVTDTNYDVVLHNTHFGYYYQILGTTNLASPITWSLEQEITSGSANQTSVDNISRRDRPILFLRAVGETGIEVSSIADASEPDTADSFSGQSGVFRITRSGRTDTNLTVYFKLGGAAIYGVDYTNTVGTVGTNLIGSVLMPSSQAVVDFEIVPFEDDPGLLEFDEQLTLTLLPTNTYVLKPPTNAIMTIEDYFTHTNNPPFSNRLFSIVVSNLTQPIGLDYSPMTNSLIASVNHSTGSPFNFLRIGTNTSGFLVTTQWSGVQNVGDEVKLATVKHTLNGFTNGDMYFGSDTGIGWLSANGSVSNLSWCTLTNDIVTNALAIRGSLYVDQTGVWNNELIAVTSDSGVPPVSSDKGVWRVDSLGHPIFVTNIFTPHLEGVITLTNDVQKWGPWAGKIVTGDESFRDENGQLKPLIYAIATNGIVASFALGIQPEDFDLIQTNQDLYCTDVGGGIVKLSKSLLANYVNDVLITQAGEGSLPKLFIAHWNGSGFEIRSMPYPFLAGGTLEHVTFAPINSPGL